MGPSDLVSVAEEGARQQRQKKRTVYSLVVPLRAYYDTNPEGAVQAELSEVIHRVEQRGWTLDQVSSFSHGHGASGNNQLCALLIFRAADR